MLSIDELELQRSHASMLAKVRAKFGRPWNVTADTQAPAVTTPTVEDSPALLTPIILRTCTVCDDEISLLKLLEQESNQLPGPIVENGTLLGVSTTRIAMWKACDKQILTVDLFAWNPWGLTSEQHRDSTKQMLYCLTKNI